MTSFVTHNPLERSQPCYINPDEILSVRPPPSPKPWTRTVTRIASRVSPQTCLKMDVIFRPVQIVMYLLLIWTKSLPWLSPLHSIHNIVVGVLKRSLWGKFTSRLKIIPNYNYWRWSITRWRPRINWRLSRRRFWKRWRANTKSRTVSHFLFNNFQQLEHFKGGNLARQFKSQRHEDIAAWAALYQTSVKKLRESTEKWKDGLDVTLVFVSHSLCSISYLTLYLD